MSTVQLHATGDLKVLNIRAIANLIGEDWPRVKETGTPTAFGNVGQHPANPYWNAMLQINDVDQTYGMDPAREIVMRFLGNAQGWRGEFAKAVKAELKRRLGVK